ncbi:hypothetical protein PoB_000344700 [Plakobranchus ocellatus]|uniref:Uncharacterized protein n=1 Tax=Plakobranchus ocellatus TaxID=259542 RepID=A0AAV3Y4D8_9GAST|nr:hypothetical protein PoB_000344700 [Plakobranchus ocellatus]
MVAEKESGRERYAEGLAEIENESQRETRRVRKKSKMVAEKESGRKREIRGGFGRNRERESERDTKSQEEIENGGGKESGRKREIRGGFGRNRERESERERGELEKKCV